MAVTPGQYGKGLGIAWVCRDCGEVHGIRASEDDVCARCGWRRPMVPVDDDGGDE